uniref:Chitin-binding type-2 domain-containing protein n=1 Tax=Anopheles christyi TaxID=43041 RepID=A0A182KCN0_9DIPT
MDCRMWYSIVVLLLVTGSLGLYSANNERCTCVPGPPDYLCPTAPLLQVYLPHELYCTRYYKCTDGRAIEFQCPYGLYFDTQNNTCTCDFKLCYRQDPCIVFVDSCRCCQQKFENTGLAPENFYLCYNDGYAVATTCPVALDPCTGSQVQLQFVNHKCEVPPPSTQAIYLGMTFYITHKYFKEVYNDPKIQ